MNILITGAAGFVGKNLTAARLNTKSAFWQAVSSSAGSESMS